MGQYIVDKANKSDIGFIVNAVLEIEKKGKSNTYNQLFNTSTKETFEILSSIFEDQEIENTELSLNTYRVIRNEQGNTIACLSIIYTNAEYYINKSELFLDFLPTKSASYFIQMVQQLPNTKEVSENKLFLEYIYTDPYFRGKGLATQLIESQYNNPKIKNEIYINVLGNNETAINYYKKLGCIVDIEVVIDKDTPLVYPSNKKIMMKKFIR